MAAEGGEQGFPGSLTVVQVAKPLSREEPEPLSPGGWGRVAGLSQTYRSHCVKHVLKSYSHCPGRCRRTADKTPGHGPARLNTSHDRARPEPWTMQHLCTRKATRRTRQWCFLNLVS
jgi:hypothetical protein